MSRGDDDDPVIDAFVKFRHHVDAAVAAGFNTFFGPSGPMMAPTTPSSAPPGRRTVAPASNMDRDPSQSQPFDAISVAFSPYSPAALSELPPPVPNDLPPDLEPDSFTFDDAFEDLLVASQGRPLPDIYSRYRKRMLLRDMYPNGEPEALWLRRHINQARGDPSSRPPFSGRGSQNWEEFHRELERRAPWVWHVPDDDDEKSRRTEPGWLRELTEASKALSDAFSDRVGPSKERNQDDDARREPNSFDELFSAIESTVAEGQKSLETFIKAITPPETPRTSQSSHDTRQVVSRDEHVDSHGYKHSTVTTRTLDRDGNEVGRETSYSCRPAEPQVPHHERSGIDADTSVQEAPKKSGWFWK